MSMSSLTVVGVWLRVLDEGAAHLADEGAANESLRFCVDVLSEAAVAEGAGEEDTAEEDAVEEDGCEKRLLTTEVSLITDQSYTTRLVYISISA